jgi:homoserine acetyltransferase
VRTQALGSSRAATECVATCGFGGDTAAPPRTIKAPTLLLGPKLDLHNSIDDAIETATLVPSATLVRLDSQAGHAVAADISLELDDIRGAIGKFLTSHTGPRWGIRAPAALAVLLDSARRRAHF